MSFPESLAAVSRRLPDVRGKVTAAWKLHGWYMARGAPSESWRLDLRDGSRYVLPSAARMTWTAAYRGAYDAAAQRSHVMRATLAGATELTAPPGASYVYFSGASDSGAVIATAILPVGMRSVLYPAGSSTPIELPTGPFSDPVPVDVNDDGVVAGTGQIGSEPHAWVFDGGVLTDLGAPVGGYSSAQFVDASGVVYGLAAEQAAPAHLGTVAGDGVGRPARGGDLADRIRSRAERLPELLGPGLRSGEPTADADDRDGLAAARRKRRCFICHTGVLHPRHLFVHSP